MVRPVRVSGAGGPQTRLMALPAEKTAVPAEKFDLEDYAGYYRETRDAYLKDANELKDATGPYKAARDTNVASTASATYTKSL